MDSIQRIQQQRAREAAERNRLYARLDREAARRVVTQVPLPKARPKAVPKPKPSPNSRPAPRSAGRDPARLQALLQRILSEMSVPSQREVLIRAQELVRTPEFKDVPVPTAEEVRAFLADKPRFQAKFPVPEFPGRAQYGTRPLEVLGADLIEKDKTTRAVKGNYKLSLIHI